MDMPLWLEYLFKGIAVFALLCFSGIITTRAGKNPYFALLLLIPFVQVAAIWAFAFSRWPKVDKK
jgi:hypothetical protein